MKKFLAAVLILSLITASVVTALAYSAWGTSVMYVKTANGKPVNVRSGPATTYDKVASVSAGSQYQLVVKGNGWYKIALGNRKYGWVSADYSSLIADSAGSAANTTPTTIVAPPKRKYTHRHEPNLARMTATSAPETSMPVYIAPWWSESAVVRVVLCSSAISA